jgi:hypothetical protein
MRPQWLLVVLGMSFTDAQADYPAQPHWSEAQRQVWETVLQWNDAFEANDADRYFSFIDEGVVVLTPSSPWRVEYRGPDRREFEFAIEPMNGRDGSANAAMPRSSFTRSRAVSCCGNPAAAASACRRD